MPTNEKTSPLKLKFGRFALPLPHAFTLPYLRGTILTRLFLPLLNPTKPEIRIKMFLVKILIVAHMPQIGSSLLLLILLIYFLYISYNSSMLPTKIRSEIKYCRTFKISNISSFLWKKSIFTTQFTQLFLFLHFIYKI